MKKLIVTVVVIASSLLPVAGVVHAERGNIGGVGVTNTRGVVSPMERGNIGGIGTNESGSIVPW